MKYNPAFLDEETLVESFVARQPELRLILEIVRENTGGANQHVIIVGPRGMGKTTLALRVVAETRMDETLSDTWYPIVFGEESYQVTTPGEFWLEALFHLGEQTGKSRWQESYEELRRESDEERLCQRALAQLMDFADGQGKRILLVAENLNMLLGDQVSSDEAWTLRHTLINEPRIMLLGTATSRFEEIEEYDKAMYDQFKIIDLDPLKDGEVQALWESVTGEEPAQNEVRPIQILTGGNPRLIRIISEFAADTSFRDLMENLTQLVDEHTEYFKRHLDSLSPQERKVFVALADLWDPSTTREVAEAARLDTNRTSAVLGRLKDRGAVTVVGKRGRAKYYQVAERMYNIYHLMRRRGQAASRVRAVVRFMIYFYSGEELVDKITAIAEEAQELAPGRREEHFQAYKAVVSMTQDPELETQIVREAGPLFSSLPDAPQSVEELTPPRSSIEEIELKPAGGEKDLLLGRAIGEVEDVDTLLKIGSVSSEEGDIERAKLAYQKAVKMEPENIVAMFRLGVFLGRQSNHEKALEIFKEVTKIKPSIAVAWYNKGVALEGANRYEEALDAYDQALQLDKTYADAWYGKGIALMNIDQYNEALEAYDRALELDETNAEAWHGKGISLGSLGRHDEALEAFDQALKLDETYVGARHNKGAALANLNQYENALEAYEQALQLNETYARAWHNKGVALGNLGRQEEALEAYEQALELDETYASAWHGKGTALGNLGRHEEALEACEQALELDETNAMAWRNKGGALESLGRYEEAADALRRALELGFEQSSVWRLLLSLYTEHLTQPDEALSVARSYLEASDHSPGALNSVGWAFFQAGWTEHLPQVETWARRAIEQEPGNANYHGTLASILGARDEWGDALDHASIYLEDPEIVGETLDDAIDFFVAAAAAGYTEEALQCIQNSPSTEALEPMIVALKKDQGEDLTVATEIEEVAKDVLERIESRREERSE